MDSRPDPATLLRDAVAGLGEGRTWRSVAYVSLSVLTRILLFVVSAAMIVATLVLCIVGIGFPLTVGAHVVINRLVGVERGLARMVGADIAGRPPSSGSLMERFRNGDRWREVVFSITAWLPTTLIFSALIAVWGVAFYLLSIPLWGWAVESLAWPEIIAMAIAGGGLLLLAPILSHQLGLLLVRYTEALVGPDRVALMEQQVREVSRNREEILAAVAGERRRIERNLHDGVQQQLVALGIDIGLARAKLQSDPEAAEVLLAEATKKTRESIGELRVIGRGLHPAILDDRGLDAALSAVVSASSVPVELRCELPVNPPTPIQEAAYFLVSEALTNVMKHSKANIAVVEVVSNDAELVVSIYDDGKGGATMSGTGLAGIAARARGLQGTVEVASPPGGPTTVSAVLPYPRSSLDTPPS